MYPYVRLSDDRQAVPDSEGQARRDSAQPHWLVPPYSDRGMESILRVSESMEAPVTVMDGHGDF